MKHIGVAKYQGKQVQLACTRSTRGRELQSMDKVLKASIQNARLETWLFDQEKQHTI